MNIPIRCAWMSENEGGLWQQVVHIVEGRKKGNEPSEWVSI